MLDVGIDMVKIDKIKKAMMRKSFLSKILGEEEYKQLQSMGFSAQSVAGNFCAKEAFSKAIGTGFRGIILKEIQIIRNSLGKPYIKLFGKALNLYGEPKNYFSVSISHTEDLAIAIVTRQHD